MASTNDPYAHAVRSSLKMKSDGKVNKNKKKKSKDKQQNSNSKLEEAVKNNTSDKAAATEPTKTKAELAFLRQQEKMKMQKILEKAAMTHKQRVEKFNQHLDSLTEHFDIPKVSWTK